MMVRLHVKTLALGLVVLGIGAPRVLASGLPSVQQITTGTPNRVGAVNNAGIVVGAGPVNADPTQPTQAFVTSSTGPVYLGTLPGGNYSSAAAINSTGMVVGESTFNGGSDKRAFRYAGGTMTNLGTLGGTYSTATSINSSGQVVGLSSLAGDSATHAFLYAGGTMTDLGTLGGSTSSAAAINDAGQITGQSVTASGLTHAFLISAAGGAMTDLGTLGGSTSFGYGINNAGKVVGQSYTTGDASAHAFLYSNGTMTDLGTLDGFRGSVARSINSDGVVVGNVYGKVDPTTKAFVQHAFVYKNGVMQNLNDSLPPGSGWVLTEATSINDLGQISGFGLYNGVRSAYLLGSNLTPVPEPTTLALLVMVGAGLGYRRYTRRAR